MIFKTKIDLFGLFLERELAILEKIFIDGNNILKVAMIFIAVGNDLNQRLLIGQLFLEQREGIGLTNSDQCNLELADRDNKFIHGRNIYKIFEVTELKMGSDQICIKFDQF